MRPFMVILIKIFIILDSMCVLFYLPGGPKKTSDVCWPISVDQKSISRCMVEEGLT